MILSEAEKLEAARESKDETNQKDVDEAAVNPDIVEIEATPNAQPSTPQQAGTDSVNNFRNIYITKPPAAMLKDHLGTWYTVPWRVAQTFDVSKPTALGMSGRLTCLGY